MTALPASTVQNVLFDQACANERPLHDRLVVEVRRPLFPVRAGKEQLRLGVIPRLHEMKPTRDTWAAENIAAETKTANTAPNRKSCRSTTPRNSHSSIGTVNIRARAEADVSRLGRPMERSHQLWTGRLLQEPERETEAAQTDCGEC